MIEFHQGNVIMSRADVMYLWFVVVVISILPETAETGTCDLCISEYTATVV